MPTQTTNFGLDKPLVDNAADEDLFGDQINADLDDIDSLVLSALNSVPSSKTVSFSVTAPTSGSASVGDSNKLFLCDATAGGINVSLPTAVSSGQGFVIHFKKTDVSVNAVVITPDGTEIIDGNASYSLPSQYDWVSIVSDGVSSWNVTSKTPPQISSESIANNTVFGNISGSSTSPYAIGVSDLLDSVFGTTQGGILYRGASAWALLSPGTSGQYLKANGTGANPSWATFSTSTGYVSTDQGYNNVGSFCTCLYNSGGSWSVISPGTTVSGSSLYPAGATQTTIASSGTSLTGTWRCLGYVAASTSGTLTATLFQRIA